MITLFPKTKKFAFSIVDDTDHATVERIKPIYDLLLNLNIKITKSVWSFPSDDKNNKYYDSQTLMDDEYLEYIKWLHKNGFEIAFHGASMASSGRDKIIEALNNFKNNLGFYPTLYINHSMNRENIYWGHERLNNPFFRWIMKIKHKSSRFEGHVDNSPYFWGDICQKHIKYVRNFVFNDQNIFKINPSIPYHDEKRPFVNYWFSSSDGGSVDSFNELLKIENQERLEKEHGICIVYTHFGNKFVQNGKINPDTSYLLTELSKRNGWFVPTVE